MKTRNLMTIFTLTLIVSFATAFATDALADSSRFSGKRTVEVHERYVSRGGDQGTRYERREVRPGRGDRHEARWERRERWEHRDRHDARWERRERWEHRDRHRSHDRYCDAREHRHWRRHRHDHDGHVSFFLGWGIGHTGVIIGLP